MSPGARPSADRCPGLLRPHRAEDGAVVRIRIPGGQTDAATLLALSQLAGEHGNPDLQLTSRGNLQLRGIDEDRLVELSAAVDELGLLPSAEHDRVRNIVASPLTGLSPDHPDLRDLIAELDGRICANPLLTSLPGRFLFGLDDGSGDVIGSADLAYLATDDDHGWLWADGRGYPVPRVEAAYALVREAEAFLAARATLGRPIWHVAELPWPLLADHPTLDVPTGAPVRLGVVEEAASVAVPLALLTPHQARVVAAVGTGVVITPWRGLVLPKAGEHLPALAAAGLVPAADSPWRWLSACVGSPGCAKSAISTRDRARELAEHWPGLERPVHVSGCRRRCGAPRGRYRDLMAPTSLAESLTRLGDDPTTVPQPTARYDYTRDGTEIYARSFATIRAEADLSGVSAELAPVVVRMIHAAGDVELVADVAAHGRLVEVVRAALADHATVYTDSEMLAAGITRRRLPADNPVRCLLNDHRTPELARRWSTTRAAAAVSLWGEDLQGAVVAIGNAPTALFHLLERIADGGPRPAAIIGIPVGFVGSAESKIALADNPWDLPYLVLHGRRGGSAICAAAINALATPSEK